jgi:tetratricopeptide (TPR) repeat protein
MTRYNNLLLSFLLLAIHALFAQGKPNVWIYTDMSDKSIPGKNHMNTVNDPDDISAMAGYLLMASEFNTMGIVVASTHRSEHKNSANQADWANEFFGKAYQQDLGKLNSGIGGYPKQLKFVESCIKSTAEKYDASKLYKSLSNYNTVESLYKLLLDAKDPIYVLCWGTVTEPAILVNYCLGMGRTDLLKKLRFIAHWTNSPLHQGTRENPEFVANCREDAAACAYMKEQALKGIIEYYELGAIGQHGIVSGAPKGEAFYNQFKSSALGRIFSEGKYVQNCVDHSDAATYWVLLQKWGVSLADVRSDGTNSAEIEKTNEEKFKERSKDIHEELLRRSKLAGD